MNEPKPRKGKTALPKDWEPSDSVRTWAKVNAPNIDFHGTVLEFRDYAHGRDWRMADWDATFRNWLRKAVKTGDRKHPMSAPQKPRPPMIAHTDYEARNICRWQAASNLILLRVLRMANGVPDAALPELVKAKQQMGTRLRDLYGDKDAPEKEWQKIAADGLRWLLKKAQAS